MGSKRSSSLRRVVRAAVLSALWPVAGLAQSTAPVAPAVSPAPTHAPTTIPGSAPNASAIGRLPDRNVVDGGFWAPFKAVPGDFARFFSTDSLKIVGIAGIGAIAAHRWDDDAVQGAREHLRPGPFSAGNTGGQFLVQAGSAIGVYSIARLAGSESLAAVGSDLVRAQVLSQGIVHAGKFATHRQRPDSSNHHSLPSGHTASAFAGATVLQHHFGWKVGLPAYGFGAYVAAARMSADKHHLSDVILGAAVGVAAARTVTLGSGRARFDVGVAPAAGGAAITFTKH